MRDYLNNLFYKLHTKVLESLNTHENVQCTYEFAHDEDDKVILQINFPQMDLAGEFSLNIFNKYQIGNRNKKQKNILQHQYDPKLFCIQLWENELQTFANDPTLSLDKNILDKDNFYGFNPEQGFLTDDEKNILTIIEEHRAVAKTIKAWVELKNDGSLEYDDIDLQFNLKQLANPDKERPSRTKHLSLKKDEKRQLVNVNLPKVYPGPAKPPIFLTKKKRNPNERIKKAIYQFIKKNLRYAFAA